jgi:hypothetical protein
MLAAVIVALLGAGTLVAISHASAQQGKAGAAGRRRAGGQQRDTATGGPLRVLSVSPADRSRGVNGAAPIRVTFSAPLSPATQLPQLRPHIAGNWQRASASTLEFVPRSGFTEGTAVRLRIPAGMTSAGGAQLGAPVSVRFRTGHYSRLGLDTLLAELGYLPLTWTAASGRQAGTASAPSTSSTASTAGTAMSTAYRPPPGTFSWQPGYPAVLHRMWHPGRPNMIVHGAIMAFEADHGLAMDGVAGPQVWSALLRAAARGERNSHGYTYAVARESTPETLTVWHNGQVILHSLANTGIPAAPTAIGTSPVYLRYQFQIMRGTNPDGSRYADPVSWVSYFRAGEAVHYFPRASYGYPQSLGCIELPYTQAKQVWPYMTYGTLVTVRP